MINVIYLPKVNSTNTYAKALLNSGEPLCPYTVIYAKEQTAGRGRRGRSWHCHEGDSLCMSLILPYTCKSGITLLTALGVYKALRDICPNIKIKWPNDIIADNKKLCGILTEGTKSGTVVGIGINLNHTTFPTDIAHKATSLRLLTGDSFTPAEILNKVAVSVFDEIEKYNAELTDNAIDEYIPLCANIGREILWNGKNGVATGISENGSLIIKTEHGTEQVSFGEVFVSGIY
ncbi:MAG: biotin--[Ruminococcus sp.]|nr:biotin--[acetyl-CoA-carboxylase] ligase [Ruminococcus sp.]